MSDTYAYEYDGAGRLTASTRYSGSSSSPLTTLTERDITYDKSGNLLTIKRFDANSATTPVDDLTFTYTGTKRNGYSYDTHGNMTADNINGTSIAWNVIGLPKSISDNTNTARRVYAADGTLLAVYEGTSGTTGRVYVGSLDIVRASNGALTVESAGWEGERLLPGTGNDKVLSQITDHLGSVRAVKDGAGNILQRIDYYPFGSVSAGWSSSTTPAQPTIRYRFSGKEIAGQIVGASAPAGTPAAAAGNPYMDFGARLYDPRTATWLSHDPLAEKFFGISPFIYCAANPVNLVDLDGKDIIIHGAQGSSVMIFTSVIDIEWDFSSTRLDFLGNYFFDGIESAITFFDMMGIADPSFVCDGISTILNLYQGKWGDAFLSALATIPYLGDVTKIKHLDEYTDLYKTIIHGHHIIPKAVYKKMDELWTVMEKNNKIIRVPAGFHGNHPKYSKWIENELNDIIINEGKLTPESVNRLIKKATDEINNSFIHYQKTGENMNTYFEKLL